MASNDTVVIDIIARFKDKASSETAKTKKSIRDIETAADNLSKKKRSIRIEADAKGAHTTIRSIEKSATSLTKRAFKGTIDFLDKATPIVDKALNKTRSFTSKVWKTTLSVVDKFTSPLTKLKNMLFSINTLITGVAAGLATKLVVADPVSEADTYTTSTIFFETKLGSTEKATKMMSDIMDFAKVTPFDTQGVIDGVRQMMAYGIETENVLNYMEKIGNVTSAMGAGEAGIESITRALGQMKAAGRVNAQDMMQLTSVGVTGWQYIADGMGKTVAEVRKMSEDGELAADEAIKHIMNGLSEYDGMMDKLSNRTVSGIASNLKDAFDQSIVLKWGQGLQKGAVEGLQNVKVWLDRVDPLLQKAGTSLEELGEAASTKFFGVIDKLMSKAEKSLISDAFKNATIGGKIKILWDDLIWNPFTEWWESKGKPKLTKKMGEFGESLGSGISDMLLTLLGAAPEVTDSGVSIGSSFAKGFAEGFDGSAIKDALIEAINGVWDALPAWAKMLVGGYVGSKALSGITSLVSGVSSVVKFGADTIGVMRGVKSLADVGTGSATLAQILGSTGNAMVSGSGLLGKFSSVGYGLSGASKAGLYFGSTAGTMSGGSAAALGAGAVAGGVVGGATLISGGVDLFKSIKAFKAGDKTEGDARAASGGLKVGGVLTGAAIGTAIAPGVGTLIGAGIGGIAGWIGGKHTSDKIRKNAVETAYESERMQEMLKDSSYSAEEISEAFQEVVRENLVSHFGKIKLTVQEISDIAKKVVFGDNLDSFNEFNTAVMTAENSLTALQTATGTLNKMNWRASIGVNLDDEDIDNFKSSVENFISSAKQYIEDEHYEFTAAVSLLVDPTSKEAKSIIANGDAWFASIQEELNGLGDELTKQTKIALKDGIVTLDEQAELQNLQQQIASITNKLARAETEAGFEVLKLKFGGGNIDAESFSQLQQEIQSQVSSAVTSYDEALTTSITSLKLQLADGAIDEETYEAELNTLMGTYNANIAKLGAQVEDVQLEILGDAYTDILGDDAKQDLNQALNAAITEGIDPIEWSAEELGKKLGVSNLSEESAAAISSALSQVADSLPKHLSEGGVMLDLSTAISSAFDFEIDPDKAVNITDETVTGIVEKTQSVINSAFETPPTLPNVSTSTGTGVSNAITNVDMTPIDTAAGGLYTNTGTSIQNKFDTPFAVTSTVDVTLDYNITNPTANIGLTGNGSSVSAYVVANNAEGGYIGSKTLSWLAEEGTPEMVIPLGVKRRDRALSLWARTGELLGVKPENNALGGIVGGNISESPSSNAPLASYRQSGGNIEVSIGNITFEIKSSDNPSDILAAIKAQKEAIVDVVSEALYEALLVQFGNRPMAVR